MGRQPKNTVSMCNARTIVRQRIREARDAAGLSQAEFGLAVGVGHTTIQGWEYGKTFPSPENLESLAAATNRPITWFFKTAEEVELETGQPIQILRIGEASVARDGMDHDAKPIEGTPEDNPSKKPPSAPRIPARGASDELLLEVIRLNQEVVRTNQALIAHMLEQKDEMLKQNAEILAHNKRVIEQKQPGSCSAPQAPRLPQRPRV